MTKKGTSKKDSAMMTPIEVGSILERIEGEFKIFGDGLVGLREDVKEVKSTQDTTLEKVALLEIRMGRVEDKLEGVEGRLGRVETATLEIAKTTREIKENVTDHTIRIAKLEEVSAK